jgi:adenylate cyclase
MPDYLEELSFRPESRVVLVGTTICPRDKQYLPPLPQVEQNIHYLTRLFTDPNVVGLPSESVVPILDHEEASAILTAIETAAERATDTLIVYYAGHGLYGDQNSPLYLVSKNTVSARKTSAIRITDVKNAIRSSRATKRILLLDCCYSGRALEGGMGSAEDEVRSAIDLAGTYAIAAVPGDYKALALPGDLLTKFTQALVYVLERGVPGDAQVLTVDKVFNQVKAQISREAGMPLPEASNWKDGGFFKLAKNRHLAWARRAEAEARRKAEEEQQAAEARRRAEEEQQAAEARRRAEEEQQAAEARRRAEEEQIDDEARLSSEDLLALVHSAKELGSEIDLSDLLDKILQRGCDLTNSPSAAIFLDDEGKGLFAAAASGPKAEGLLSHFGEASANRVPYEGSKAGRVFVSGEALLEGSIRSDPEHFKAVDERLHHLTESMVCVPLKTRDDCIGVVQLLNKVSGDYSQHDIVLLEHLASLASLAIHNARLFQELLAHKGLLTSSTKGRKTSDLIRELSAPAHRERMTVLFADMRGFTRLLQSIGDPIDIVGHVNEFLELLANQVLSYDGLVNKFLGDGVLALFRGPDSEMRATRAAFDIVDRFDEMKERWNRERSEALNFLDVGVGIVTGDVIIGSIGTGRVRDFTAIGAFVNLAAAFENDARGGNRVLVDQSTFRAVAGIIAEADKPTIYEMRKPDQPSGVQYTRYHIRRILRANDDPGDGKRDQV